MLAARAKNLLAEEAQKDQVEATKIKSIEAILKRMEELEKAFAKGDLCSDRGMQDTGGQGQDTDKV